MATYKDLESLKKALLPKIIDVLGDEIPKEIKKIESEEIQKHVLDFDVYKPREYKRRDEHHGIQAVENMNHEVIVTDGKVVVSVVNDTPVADSTHTYRLDEAIVEGGGEFYEYPYGNADEEIYTYLKGRDFITPTQERVNTSGEVINALKNGLKAKGLKIVDK